MQFSVLLRRLLQGLPIQIYKKQKFKKSSLEQIPPFNSIHEVNAETVWKFSHFQKGFFSAETIRYVDRTCAES